MHRLPSSNTVRKNIAILSASQFISDIGTASYISFVNLWLIQVFKDSILVGTIVSITEIAMFFLAPLITTFIKGKNIKTMLVGSDYLLLLMMMLLRILHFANATIIYASIINGCIFTIVGMLNSLLEAYTMRSIDEQYLGQYYTVFGNLNVLLMPVITYTLGFVLRFVPPVYVYTAAGFILLLPTLYIHMQMHLKTIL